MHIFTLQVQKLQLLFVNSNDYDNIDEGDELLIEDVKNQIAGKDISVINKTKGISFRTIADLTDREAELVIAGGQLRLVLNKNKYA